MTFSALVAACIAVVIAGTTSVAQSVPGGLTAAPAAGVGVYVLDGAAGRRTVARPAAGADVGLGLGARWGLGAAYRTVDPGGEDRRVHAVSAALRWVALDRLSLRVGLEAGGQLAGPTREGGELGYGPRAGVTLDVPLSLRWSLAVGASVAGLAGDGPADLWTEATAGVQVRPFARRCGPPAPADLEVPRSLLPFERGRFVLDGGPASEVVWEFGDGVVLRGGAVERAFGEPGTYAYRATVVRCGALHVIEGTVAVAPPCWAPPTVEVVARAPTLASDPFVVRAPIAVAPLTPVVLSAQAGGTPPLTYRWRYPGGTDTTAALALRYPVGGRYRVELEVTNCTGRTATAVTEIAVNEQLLPGPIQIAFDFAQCVPASLSNLPLPQLPPAFRGNTLPSPEELRPFATALAEDPSLVLVVDGYADEVDASYNWALSWGRADMTRRYLQDVFRRHYPPGLLDGRLVVRAWGETETPACTSRSPLLGCLEQRRIHLHLATRTHTPPEGAPPCGRPVPPRTPRREPSQCRVPPELAEPGRTAPLDCSEARRDPEPASGSGRR
jgi:hypothetical protein